MTAATGAGHRTKPDRVHRVNQPESATDRTLTRTFPAHARQIAAVRRFVADAIAGFAAMDDVVLLTSEVATNAVVHGSPDDGSDAQLTVVVRRRLPGRVRVEISDYGIPSAEGNAPRLVEASSIDEGFRGLALVDDLATAWGSTSETNGGHRVWFEVVAP